MGLQAINCLSKLFELYLLILALFSFNTKIFVELVVGVAQVSTLLHLFLKLDCNVFKLSGFGF